MQNNWNRILEWNHGVVHALDLHAEGVTSGQLRHLVRSGQLVRVGPRIYRSSAAPMSWRQKVRIGIELVPGGIGFRRTAAALHGLQEFGPREIEILTRARYVPRPIPGMTFHRTNFLPDDSVAVVDGIPTTDVPRTLLDLGGVADVKVVRRAALYAVERRLTTPDLIWRQIEMAARPGRGGSANLRRAVDGIDWERDRTDTELEGVCYHLLTTESFPEPARQWVYEVEGVFLARLDLGYPRDAVGIECDSWGFHSGRAEFVRDRQRQNSLVAHGIRIFRFTWEDARHPQRFLADLARVVPRL